ncbi:MAG: tyrosine-type recombinase/integrase [Fretibacterium sp.]|nr:tyrosine-type recombinase/integrase [Fretibacterium sp.]
MSLSELKIKNLKPRKSRYLVNDGQGLYIAVMPTGEKYWYVRTRDGGIERKHSLGRYPDIGLKEARELRYTMKSRQKETPTLLSAVAEEWYQTRCVPVLAEKTLRNKRSHLDRFILPLFGGRDIKKLTPQELKQTLQKIQHDRGPHVGHRVRGILSQIFRYAIASGLCDYNPAQQLVGALAPLPPSQHYSTVRTEDDARQILHAVSAYNGNPIIRLGLLLLAYTFVRPSEMRLAQWAELDLEKREWRIPASRMKMKRDHIVPLSTQTTALFSELRTLTRHPVWCFVLPTESRPLSSVVFHKAMRTMGYGTGKMTPHGFRGMASTLLNEHGFPPDVIERQLAHVEGNAVRAAYNRAEYLDQRRQMMQWWGDYLNKLRDSGAGRH